MKTSFGWHVILALVLVAGCSADRPANGHARQHALQTQLDKIKAEFAKTGPPEMLRVFEEGIETLREAGVGREAPKVGDPAPLFALPDATGKSVNLRDLLKQGPVVLAWYRGGWCPYCNVTLQALQNELPEFGEFGATLVAISPETPDHTLTTAQKNILEFTVLSDVGNKVARRYGLVYTLPAPVAEQFEGRIDLQEYNGDDQNELPLAATFVIDTDGVVRYTFVNVDYRRRAEPSDIIQALRSLTTE
jgi:peroxiredoxin